MVRRWIPADTTASVSYTAGPSASGNDPCNPLWPAVTVPSATLVVVGATQASATSGGLGDYEASASLEYSTNGGGAWLTVPGSSVAAASAGGGSDGPYNGTGGTVSLGSVDMSQIRVRAIGAAVENAAPGGSAADADITDWYVEVPLGGTVLEV